MVDDATATSGASPVGHSTRERLIFVLWRRKWVLIATFLLITAVTATVSKSLPKVYQATTTLWVTENKGTAALDAVQAGEALARTYAEVADSPILAAEVVAALPFETSRGELLGSMSFEPVTETQLLRITTEDGDPERARLKANTYAAAFIDYSSRQLGEAADSEITIVDRASLPAQPERPKPTLYTLAGAFFGLLAGIGMAFIADLLDRRVRSREELEWILPAPVLAQVPNNTHTPATEAAFQETFRLLRTNLQFTKRRNDSSLRSLTIVSPSEGDGKSSVSYNLAMSLAQTGQSVILVEGDMRRPALHQQVLLDGEQVVAGLSTFLSAATPDLEDVIYPTEHPNLTFVPAGALPPSPANLLDAGHGRALIDVLSQNASMVIIDTPPLSVGAEASTLAASSDGSLMVVDLRRSTKAAIRSARHQLQVINAELLGVVLNRVRQTPEIGAYAYRYQMGENGREGGSVRSPRTAARQSQS